MNDFLTALAARTLGVAPVVTPRRLSRFESDSRGLAPEKTDAQERDESSLKPSTPKGQRPAVQRSAVSAQDGRDRPTLDTAGPARNHSEIARTPLPAFQPVVPVRRSDGLPARVESARAPYIADRRTELPPKSPSPLSREPDRGAPRLRSLNQPLNPVDATPAIHVTIGRVEVRAIHHPAPTPAARPQPEPPRFTLGEYLRKGRS